MMLAVHSWGWMQMRHGSTSLTWIQENWKHLWQRTTLQTRSWHESITLMQDAQQTWCKVPPKDWFERQVCRHWKNLSEPCPQANCSEPQECNNLVAVSGAGSCMAGMAAAIPIWILVWRPHTNPKWRNAAEPSSQWTQKKTEQPFGAKCLQRRTW